VLSCGLTTREEDPPMTRPPTNEEVDRRKTLIDDLKKQVNHGIPKEKRKSVPMARREFGMFCVKGPKQEPGVIFVEML
jgi:hypothetical protein